MSTALWAPTPDAGGERRGQHLQGNTWGYLFLDTFSGSSASTFDCSFPTSFSSCRTGEKISTNVPLESSWSAQLPAHGQWLCLEGKEDYSHTENCSTRPSDGLHTLNHSGFSHCLFQQHCSYLKEKPKNKYWRKKPQKSTKSTTKLRGFSAEQTKISCAASASAPVLTQEAREGDLRRV